jgi:SAM-dependent methyltransferase
MTSVDSVSYYQCPCTGGRLVPYAGGVRTVSGEHVYPVHHEVPNFLRYPAQTSAKLQRLNEVARTDGWRQALEQVMGDPGLLRYVTQSDRAKFLDLLPLDCDQIVLEIGPGLGQVTVPLAQRTGHVLCLEVDEGQAEFVLQRAQQSGCNNVDVACGGDDCRLPFQSDQFNGVVLNLVLEWCGGKCEERSLVDSQTLLLAEIHRLLKPGGFLYLATKNRYSLHYLLGHKDEHAWQMRFGNALPRWLMNWRTRQRGHHRTSGLLHSYGELARMIEAAGFQQLQPYWAAPEMRFPDRYVPLDAASVRQARQEGLRQGAFRSTDRLMRLVPAACVKHLTQGLVFVATKP